MKKTRNIISIIAIIAVASISLVNAQAPPPPNNNSGGGSSHAPDGGNTPVGGSAPIGSGVVLLIALGSAYGSKKVYDFRKHKLAE